MVKVLHSIKISTALFNAEMKAYRNTKETLEEERIKFVSLVKKFTPSKIHRKSALSFAQEFAKEERLEN